MDPLDPVATAKVNALLHALSAIGLLRASGEVDTVITIFLRASATTARSREAIGRATCERSTSFGVFDQRSSGG
jgi:hypothetical protein